MKIQKVRVRFRRDFDSRTFNSKAYDYLSAVEVEVGDLVVVETQYGLSVALVVELCTPAAEFSGSRYVVQKVDRENFEAFKLKLARVEMIKAEIEEKIREKVYMQHVETFAKDDAELAELLEELKTI